MKSFGRILFYSMFALGWIGTGGLFYDNIQLAEQTVSGDAQLEMMLDKRTGTIFIRVNRNSDNVHAFPGACPATKDL